MTPADELRKLAQRRRRTKAADDAALAERNARIYDIKTSGAMTQADICRAADLTREQISRIIKAEEERRGHPARKKPGSPAE